MPLYAALLSLSFAPIFRTNGFGTREEDDSRLFARIRCTSVGFVYINRMCGGTSRNASRSAQNGGGWTSFFFELSSFCRREFLRARGFCAWKWVDAGLGKGRIEGGGFWVPRVSFYTWPFLSIDLRDSSWRRIGAVWKYVNNVGGGMRVSYVPFWKMFSKRADIHYSSGWKITLGSIHFWWDLKILIRTCTHFCWSREKFDGQK